jgi:6-phosphogluconolactonase
MEYLVLPNPSAVANHAADIVQAEIDSYGGILLGLAGGSTPRSTYEALTDRSIDWSYTTAWMTDERWVAPDSDESNQKMARESLIEPTGVAFIAPDTTLASIDEAAEKFTGLVVPETERANRSIVLLGIGTDGHTASLFPGSSALEDSGARYIANHVPSLDTWRLTSTYGLLATADTVLFLVTGESKAEVIAAIEAGADVPSAHVTARGQVLWLLDDAAASGLWRP